MQHLQLVSDLRHHLFLTIKYSVDRRTLETLGHCDVFQDSLPLYRLRFGHAISRLDAKRSTCWTHHLLLVRYLAQFAQFGDRIGRIPIRGLRHGLYHVGYLTAIVGELHC